MCRRGRLCGGQGRGDLGTGGGAVAAGAAGER